MSRPERLDSAEAAVDLAIGRVGKRIVLGLPLALGKANHIANAFYARAKADPDLDLTIFSALSLDIPQAPNALAARLLDPITDRLYKDYPQLDYAVDRRTGALPANVTVKEFFLPPGSLMSNPTAQRDYVSSNYTHAGRDILDAGLNVIAQMVAPGLDPDTEGLSRNYSLSCNPDLSLDLVPALRERGRPHVVLGEVNADLPFLGRDAVVEPDWFDGLYDAGRYTLFPTPAETVRLADHAIGIQASALIRDGGTLQIGIGALSDALSHGLRLRHGMNRAWNEMRAALDADDGPLTEDIGGTGPFELGLYGCSEMITEGLLSLYDCGALTREVFDDEDIQARALDDPDRAPAAGGIVLQGGFYLGPASLYRRLRDMAPSLLDRIDMTSISKINHLYGDEHLKRLQRRDARFVNTAMMVNGRGAAISDTLADGRVVSGIGGQYNFAAMAQELDDGRSLILVRATRTSKGETKSNIIWEGGEASVPRHLRDIVVTEYGAADLRGKTDREVAIALARIADSRFQNAFLDAAKAAGKLEADYALPARFTNNSPERLRAALAAAQGEGLLPDYPLGTDLTEEEQALKDALEWLREATATRLKRLRVLAAALLASPKAGAFAPHLERMELDALQAISERIDRRLVLHALRQVRVG